MLFCLFFFGFLHVFLPPLSFLLQSEGEEVEKEEVVPHTETVAEDMAGGRRRPLVRPGQFKAPELPVKRPRREEV